MLYISNYYNRLRLGLLIVVSSLAGCASTPDVSHQQAEGNTVCDTYLILSMCVRDLHGDGTVDMIYFTDTNEIFMYQDGTQESVAEVMPFHRCAVPLDAGMQATTNRILNRGDLTLTEEMSITKELIANYIAAKPSIDACNASFDDATGENMQQHDEFSRYEDDWDTE